MAAVSRRKARETAMRILYEIEVGRAEVVGAMEGSLAEANLTPDLAAYAERLVWGTLNSKKAIDKTLSAIIKEYDFNRIAAVDRNILRVAAYELLEVPDVPYAVTINEAIEIAKRYSTAESGKFVNGILGQLLLTAPKEKLDPALSPPQEQESMEVEPEAQIVDEVVQEGTKEAKTAAKFGTWRIRTDAVENPDGKESRIT